MAEAESEHGTGAAGTRSKLDSAPRVGRRIAMALFWCCALYMAAVGFYSIPKQVFSPTAAAVPPATSCPEGVRALRLELLTTASERVAEGGSSDDTSLRSWLRDWDLRHVALAEHCTGPGERAHAALGRMRHRIEMIMRRFDREQAPLNREIDRGLRSPTPPRQRDLD